MIEDFMTPTQRTRLKMIRENYKMKGWETPMWRLLQITSQLEAEADKLPFPDEEESLAVVESVADANEQSEEEASDVVFGWSEKGINRWRVMPLVYDKLLTDASTEESKDEATTAVFEAFVLLEHADQVEEQRLIHERRQHYADNWIELNLAIGSYMRLKRMQSLNAPEFIVEGEYKLLGRRVANVIDAIISSIKEYNKQSEKP